MIVAKGSCLNQIIFLVLLVYISFVSGHQKQKDLIYILEWTTTYNESEWPYRYLEKGQKSFISKNCSFQNCFITTDRLYFDNLLDYDVVIFNAVHYNRFPSQNFQMPPFRSQTQQYLLFSAEPAAYNHVPDDLNGKINLTWTYKLNSDIIHPYFIVINNRNEIIGPKIDMKWIDMHDLPPTNSSITEKLKNKRLAAVWIVSNCYSKDRLLHILRLQNELRSKYGLQLDIYGRCGDENACSKNKEGFRICYEKIERDYYFYMAFENSFSEDYVSEKVLHGLKHFSVPIVYGGADYTRFLPDGIYLDAKKFSVEDLAKEMHDIINDPPRYHDFFKWHGYYRFHDVVDDMYWHAICEFCAFLNSEKRKPVSTVRIYENITNWWNVAAPDDFPFPDSFRHPIIIREETNEPETATSVMSKVVDYLLDVRTAIFLLLTIFYFVQKYKCCSVSNTAQEKK